MYARTLMVGIGMLLLSIPGSAQGRGGYGGGYNRAMNNAYQQQQRQQQQQQNQQNRNQNQNQSTDVSVDGAIQKVTGSSTSYHITVNPNADQGDQSNQTKSSTPKKSWTVTTNTKTTINTTGSAKPDFLHPRLTVEFRVQYDGKTVKDKITDMTITSVTKDKPLGIHGEGSNTPKTTFKAGSPEPCDVIGKITAVEGAKLTVQASGKSLTVLLDANPNINVQMSDASLAAAGDKITARGKRAKTASANSTSFLADDITITIADPLTAKRKPATTSTASN